MRLVPMAATVLALAAACSSGHGASRRPDPNTSIDITGAIGGAARTRCGPPPSGCWAGASSSRASPGIRARASSRSSACLRVGSTLAEARRERGIRCVFQPGYYACQGGLGYEQPVTSFTVRDGRVVRVFMAAAAD